MVLVMVRKVGFCCCVVNTMKERRERGQRLTTGISEREDKVEGLVVPRQDLDFSAETHVRSRQITSDLITSRLVDQIGEREEEREDSNTLRGSMERKRERWRSLKFSGSPTRPMLN